MSDVYSVYSVYSVNQNKFRVSKSASIIALTNKKLRFLGCVLITRRASKQDVVPISKSVLIGCP